MTTLQNNTKKKTTRLIATVSCILITLIFAYMLYASEYSLPNDKKVLSSAISEYTSQGHFPLEDVIVLETKEVGGVLIAFFKDNKKPSIYGFAELLKGVNMNYRLVRTNYEPNSYSAVVKAYKFDTNKGVYYVVGGHNIDKNIASYGIRLIDGNYSTFAKDMLRYSIENSQFLEVKKETDLQKSIEKLFAEKKDSPLYLSNNVFLLDADGNNITENYKIPNSSSTWSSGGSTAELFMLYVYIAMVLILGAVFARYFWSEK